jgi:formyltetrahydrofolate deformylase
MPAEPLLAAWAAMSGAVLLTSSPDRPGLVAAIAGAITGARLNIIDVDSHLEVGWFHQRVEVETVDGGDAVDALRAAAVVAGLDLDRTHVRPLPASPVPTALLVSKAPHCAADLLARADAGSLPIDVRVVVSNHPDLEPLARRWDVPFVHAAGGDVEGPARDAGAELLILARYMRILPPDVCERWAGRAINIHHSFLPAFVGADPYRRAHERGVKMIGATAHYVTAELDAGPIIAQDTARVSHRDTVEELRRRGAELERRVLADAVRLHADDRVVVAGDRTVVFDH